MSQFFRVTQVRLLEQQADHILSKFRQISPFPSEIPVPIETIARNLLNLKCEPRRLGREGSGRVGALSADRKTIYWDERLSWHQRSFTIAHEIGHFVLHQGNCQLQLELCGTTGVPLSSALDSARAKTKKEKHKLREIEANQLASALLVPHSHLSKAVKCYTCLDAKVIIELAAAFDVSLRTMIYRVRAMYRDLDWTGPRLNSESLDWLEDNLKESKEASKKPDRHTVHGKRQRTSPLQKSEAVRVTNFIANHAFGQPVNRFGSRDLHVTARPFSDPPRTTGGKRIPMIDQAFHRIVEEYELRRRKVRKPYIIELAGTPNAGKDTLIKVLKDYLEDVLGYRVRVINEGVKVSHVDGLLHEADLLYHTVALTIVQLYEASLENPGNYDFVIFNRGLFDRLAFLHAMHALGRISTDKERVHSDFLRSYQHFVDKTFVFLTTPEESLERETERLLVRGLCAIASSKEIRDPKRSLEPREQRILNKSMLEQLNSSYIEIYGTLDNPSRSRVQMYDYTKQGDASLLEKARGLVDAILPDRTAQLPFPELFGSFYTGVNGGDRPQPTRRRRLCKSPAPAATQLSFC